MKFGKLLHDETNNGQCLLNYKELKQIINFIDSGAEWEKTQHMEHVLQNNSAIARSEAADATDTDEPRVKEVKMAFFYRLGLELDRVNAYYLQKSSELKGRLSLITEKKQLADRRPGWDSHNIQNLGDALAEISCELDRLQRCVELNAEGFRKILKKWDKRTKSATKDLYLSRQIQVTPMFEGHSLTALCDIVAEAIQELDSRQQAQNKAPDALSPNSFSPQNASSVLREDAELLRELRDAALTRDEKVVKQFLSGRAFPSAILSRTLIESFQESSLGCLKLFLSHGADINFADELTGRSCVHEASINGQLSMLQLCTDSGGDLLASDLSGRTPLHYLAMYGHLQCVKFVLETFQSLSLNPIDKMGCVPFFYAVSAGHEKVAIQLLSAPNFRLVEYEPKSGLSPLSLAVKHGLKRLVELLLQKAVEPSGSSDTLCPLHHAAKEGRDDILELLLRYNQEIDTKDVSNGWTPLYFAAASGHEKCVRLLCNAGCDKNVLDVRGWHAWTHALYRGHIKVAEMLRPTLDAPPAVVSDNGLVVPSTLVESASPLPETGVHLAGAETWTPLNASCCLNKTPSPSAVADSDSRKRLVSLYSGTAKELSAEELPSLELPPPIVPFRIYGHNYLQKRHYIGIRFESVDDNFSLNLFKNRSLKFVKLIMHTNTGTDDGLPQSIVLPLSAGSLPLMAFPTSQQLKDDFRVTFDVYPTFGTHIIGRAVLVPRVLQRIFQNGSIEQSCVLPLIDKSLKCVGELQFYITSFGPFLHPRLEVGGPVETYWKSTKVVKLSEQSSRRSVVITASSLLKQYVTIPVQVTSDGVAVVYNRWNIRSPKLPDLVKLPVSSLTYEHGCALLERDAQFLNSLRDQLVLAADFVQALTSSFAPLELVLQELPEDMGLHIQVWRQSKVDGGGLSDDLCCNAVLKAVYDCTNSRSIIFSSFNSTFCTLLNWKQPNYPVFYGTFGGYPPFNLYDANSENELSFDKNSSIRQALKFAKSLKLFGILCYAEPLVIAPALVKTVKEAGLLLAVFSRPDSKPASSGIKVDATLENSIFWYNNEIFT